MRTYLQISLTLSFIHSTDLFSQQNLLLTTCPKFGDQLIVHLVKYL